MRYYPTSKDDKKDLQELNAQAWMIECLQMNPSYVNWGPHEDYMWVKDKGWRTSVYTEGWKNFIPEWTLDCYNEIVNFYFELSRKHHDCETCEGDGYNTATHHLAENYYYGEKWSRKLTDEDIKYLISKKRLSKEATAEKVNNDEYITDMDAINRWMLIEHRAKEQGIWGTCSRCTGLGYIYDEPKAHLNLILWVLHPRKGCSRGVEITHINREDIPEIIKYLKEAAKRNKHRFSKLNILESLEDK